MVLPMVLVVSFKPPEDDREKLGDDLRKFCLDICTYIVKLMYHKFHICSLYPFIFFSKS